MIINLTDGDTIFAIADGVSRLYQTLDRFELGMNQDTQVDQPMRGDFPVAFPERASRAYSFDLPVTFPPCASLADAFVQAHDIPAQCPRGGVLTMLVGAQLRTYNAAWVKDVKATPMGVTNLFVFSLTATDPSTSTLSTLAQMDSRYTANLSTITGLTGGGDTNLDGLVTTDVAAGRLVTLIINNGTLDEIQDWKLYAGTDAEDTSSGIVRPNDYNASTNAKVWKRMR